MARKMTKAAIQGLAVTPYKDLRATIQSGDILFCSGNYDISRMIQKATKSPWSHVGIFFWANDVDRLMLLESVEDMGVRLVPASKYLSDYENGKPYDGELVVARHHAVTPKHAVKMADKGFDKITRAYDKDEIVDILARITLDLSRPTKDNDKYICSELVEFCYRAAGVKLKFDPKGFISPENVWVDPGITFQARIL